MMSRPDRRFLFRLAAFFRLEPWGCAVEDYRAGVIASILINQNSRGKTVQPIDLFPPRHPIEKDFLLQQKINKVMMSFPQKPSNGGK